MFEIAGKRRGGLNLVRVLLVGTGLVLAGGGIGIREAAADQIPAGAPTDGKSYTVQISESANEGITKVAVGTNPNPAIEVVPNADGSFTLGIAIQPGMVTVNNMGGITSDTFTLFARGGIDLCGAGGGGCTAFFSDAFSPGEDTAEEVEVLEVGDGAGNITRFEIHSDQEPVPEPSSLILLGTGLLGLSGFWLVHKGKIRSA